jgi:hypothetical protein
MHLKMLTRNFKTSLVLFKEATNYAVMRLCLKRSNSVLFRSLSSDRNMNRRHRMSGCIGWRFPIRDKSIPPLAETNPIISVCAVLY